MNSNVCVSCEERMYGTWKCQECMEFDKNRAFLDQVKEMHERWLQSLVMPKSMIDETASPNVTPISTSQRLFDSLLRS
jgi:hypothetical protein